MDEEKKIIIVIVPKDMTKTQNFAFAQDKITSYLGQRMIKEVEETNPAMELYHPLTERDLEKLDEILEATGYVMFEFIGDDTTLVHNNILRITNAKDDES